MPFGFALTSWSLNSTCNEGGWHPLEQKPRASRVSRKQFHSVRDHNESSLQGRKISECLSRQGTAENYSPARNLFDMDTQGLAVIVPHANSGLLVESSIRLRDSFLLEGDLQICLTLKEGAILTDLVRTEFRLLKGLTPYYQALSQSIISLTGAFGSIAVVNDDDYAVGRPTLGASSKYACPILVTPGRALQQFEYVTLAKASSRLKAFRKKPFPGVFCTVDISLLTVWARWISARPGHAAHFDICLTVQLLASGPGSQLSDYVYLHEAEKWFDPQLSFEAERQWASAPDAETFDFRIALVLDCLSLLIQSGHSRQGAMKLAKHAFGRHAVHRAVQFLYRPRLNTLFTPVLVHFWSRSILGKVL